MSEGKITVTCPACGKTLSAPASRAGTKGKCPCGQEITLQAAQAPASTGDGAGTPTTQQAAPAQTPKKGAPFVFALLAVAFGLASVLLPLLAMVPTFVCAIIAWKLAHARGKDKAIALLGMVLSVCLSALTLTLFIRWQMGVGHQIRSAHALYEQGKTEEAAAIYRKQIDFAFNPDDKATAYSCLIDYSISEGDQQQAREYIGTALGMDLSLRLKSGAGKQLVALVKQERETARAEAERRRQQAKAEEERKRAEAEADEERKRAEAEAEKPGGETYVRNYHEGYKLGVLTYIKFKGELSSEGLDRIIAASKGSVPERWARPGYEEGVRDGGANRSPRYK